MQSYDHETGEGTSGPSGATPEHLARATKRVTDATTRLAGAAQTLQQSDVIAAANLARAAVSELLIVSRAAAADADSAEARYRTLDSGREVAAQVSSLHDQLLPPCPLVFVYTKLCSVRSEGC